MNKYEIGFIFGGLLAIIGGGSILMTFFAPELLPGGVDAETGNFFIGTGCLFAGTTVMLVCLYGQKMAERFFFWR